MANRLKLLALAAVVAAAASPALAQSSATVSTAGTGDIISPMTLTKAADLAFGTIIKPATGNTTVTIGTGADTVGVTAGAAAGAASRAKFTVGGEGGQTYAVTVPANFVMSAGVGNNITVTLTPSATTGTLSGALGANGTDALNVGGAFTIPSTQTSGAYSGSFDVTTAYN